MGQAIDGKKLAFEKEQIIKEEIKKLSKPPQIRSILVGSDPPSVMYTNMKQKKAQEVGVNFEPVKLADDITSDDLKKKIDELDNDPDIDGIMVQLPLPPRLKPETDEILAHISPQKDVDGLTPEGMKYFTPATVKGILSLLDFLNTDFKTQKFGVVGAEGEIGMPLMLELKKRGAKVVGVDKKIQGTSLEDIGDSDIVISATGVQGLIKPGFVKKGVVAIDVGGGELDPEVFSKASFYTPKYGGVGPMTIISLMENSLEAARKK